MSETNLQEPILTSVVNTLKSRKRLFYWLLPATLVASYALSLCVPKQYECEIKILHEAQGVRVPNYLNGVFDLLDNSGVAMQRDVWEFSMMPDIIQSTDFIIQLMKTPVQTIDGKFQGTAYEYLAQEYRYPFWKQALVDMRMGRCPWKAWTEEEKAIMRDEYEHMDSNHLRWTPDRVRAIIKKNLSCSVNYTNFIITVKFTTTDPLVSEAISKAIIANLEQYIQDYHLRKVDENTTYFEGLLTQAKSDYEQAIETYRTYSAGSSLSQGERLVREQELKDDIAIKYNLYRDVEQKYLTIKSRRIEDPISINTIQGAYAPTGAEKPRPAKNAIMWTIIVGLVTCLWLCRKEMSRYF